jgi:hypothetical protein
VADWATAISCQLRAGPSSPWWSTVLQGPQFCATHWVAQAHDLKGVDLTDTPFQPRSLSTAVAVLCTATAYRQQP